MILGFGVFSVHELSNSEEQ